MTYQGVSSLRGRGPLLFRPFSANVENPAKVTPKGHRLKKMRLTAKDLREVVASALFLAITNTQLASRAQEPHKHNLMPVPASVQFETGRLKIDYSFTVATASYRDARLESGINRAARRLEGRTGLEFRREIKPDTGSAALVVRCQGPGNAQPSVDEDESYTLEISGARAILTAPVVVGALRGLETLLQLVEAGP